MVEDFHCATCGITLHDRPPNYLHHCPGPKPIEYQRRRAAICASCPEAIENGTVCAEVKRREEAKGNLKPGMIATGVALPKVRCPLGKWQAVTIHCPGCTRLIHDPSGPKSCRYCGSSFGNNEGVNDGTNTSSVTLLDDQPAVAPE